MTPIVQEIRQTRRTIRRQEQLVRKMEQQRRSVADLGPIIGEDMRAVERVMACLLAVGLTVPMIAAIIFIAVLK